MIVTSTETNHFFTHKNSFRLKVIICEDDAANANSGHYNDCDHFGKSVFEHRSFKRKKKS